MYNDVYLSKEKQSQKINMEKLFIISLQWNVKLTCKHGWHSEAGFCNASWCL